MAVDDFVASLLLSLVTLLYTSALECKLGTNIVIRPDLYDDGTVESANYPNQYPPANSHCKVAFSACEGCRVELVLEEMFLSSCSDSLRTDKEACDHRCEHMMISQPGDPPQIFDNSTAVGSVLHLGSTFSLVFCYTDHPPGTMTVQRRWRLRFVVKDTYTHRISPGGSAGQSAVEQGSIQSPGFPQPYPPSNASVTYLLKAHRPDDCVKIVFTDFDIQLVDSYLKLYDGGTVAAPVITHTQPQHLPFLISSSSSVLVEFVPGEAANTEHMGFRAEYTFANCQQLKHVILKRDCDTLRPHGGILVEGGRYEDSEHSLELDCVWKLGSVNNTSYRAQLIQYTVYHEQERADGHEDYLEVRAGPHSGSLLLGRLSPGLQGPSGGFTSSMGLYLRLSSHLGKGGRLILAYTPYQTVAVDDEREAGCALAVDSVFLPGFLCSSNQQCIPEELTCDKASHCAEGEDELLPSCPKTQGFSLECGQHGRLTCDNQLHCYSEEQMCDGINHCSDLTDEDGCARTEARNEGEETFWHIWVFAVPTLLLISIVIIAAIMCYRWRKRSRASYQPAAACRRSAMDTEDVQMHAFPPQPNSLQPTTSSPRTTTTSPRATTTSPQRPSQAPSTPSSSQEPAYVDIQPNEPPPQEELEPLVR